MNEALCSCLFGGFDDSQSAGNIAFLKPGPVRCIHDSGNMQDYIGAAA